MGFQKEHTLPRPMQETPRLRWGPRGQREAPPRSFWTNGEERVRPGEGVEPAQHRAGHPVPLSVWPGLSPACAPGGGPGATPPGAVFEPQVTYQCPPVCTAEDTVLVLSLVGPRERPAQAWSLSKRLQ